MYTKVFIDLNRIKIEFFNQICAYFESILGAIWIRFGFIAIQRERKL